MTTFITLSRCSVKTRLELCGSNCSFVCMFRTVVSNYMQHFVFLTPIFNVHSVRIQKSLNHE
jgi:hypothetical protein